MLFDRYPLVVNTRVTPLCMAILFLFMAASCGGHPTSSRACGDVVIVGGQPPHIEGRQFACKKGVDVVFVPVEFANCVDGRILVSSALGWWFKGAAVASTEIAEFHIEQGEVAGPDGCIVRRSPVPSTDTTSPLPARMARLLD